MYVIHYDVFHECFFSTQVYISQVPINLVEILINSCSALKYTSGSKKQSLSIKVYKWIQKVI